MLVEPDIILAEGANGVLGYIYQPEGIPSPSKLDEYNKSFKKSTPLYLHDGETIIGTFFLIRLSILIELITYYKVNLCTVINIRLSYNIVKL